MDKPFVIKIEVNVISLNESLIFPLSKTNLDGKLIFTPRETLYFKVTATNLKNNEMSLNVLNYSEKDKEGFIIQLFETEINFLKFENLISIDQ